MAEKDYTEKKLEDYEEVFADIVNVLLFGGRERVLANELEAGMSRSAYKVEGKFEEQERDAKKYWRSGSVRIALYGLENQTGEDPHFPVRCIAYDGADYRDQNMQKPVISDIIRVIIQIIHKRLRLLKGIGICLTVNIIKHIQVEVAHMNMLVVLLLEVEL